MKPLLFTLSLFVAVAYGQDSTVIRFLPKTHNGEITKEYFVIALPKYWDEYVKSLEKKFNAEVANSIAEAMSREKIYKYSEDSKTAYVEYKINGEWHCDSIWKPNPTFSGFIEYLRNK